MSLGAVAQHALELLLGGEDRSASLASWRLRFKRVRNRRATTHMLQGAT